MDEDTIGIGSTVKVKEVDGEEDDVYEYKIVGTTGANSLKGSISNESPLAIALRGAKQGDIVTVEAPIGEIRYEVLSVTR